MVSCVLVAAICLTAAGWVSNEMGTITRQTEKVREQLVDAQDRLSQLLVDPKRRELVVLERQVERILAKRKPTSLLFGKVCNLVPHGIELVSISTGGDGIEVLGRARKSDGKSSLELVQEFRTKLEQLQFLERVRERVENYDGSQEWLTFHIEAEWRYQQ